MQKFGGKPYPQRTDTQLGYYGTAPPKTPRHPNSRQRPPFPSPMHRQHRRAGVATPPPQNAGAAAAAAEEEEATTTTTTTTTTRMTAAAAMIAAIAAADAADNDDDAEEFLPLLIRVLRLRLLVASPHGP